MEVKKFTRDQLKRMRERPYYAVLHAINCTGERLPKSVEEHLGSDPEACLLYSMKVLKGRLPDSLHNRMVLGEWDDHYKDMVRKYMDYLNKKPETSVS